MAIPYITALNNRRQARFHAQVEITYVARDCKTPATIPVEGRVLRIFRGDSSLSIGDRLTFQVRVCRSGDQIPTGPSYTLYDKLLSARYMEIFFNQSAWCTLLVDKQLISFAPTLWPRLPSSRLACMFEKLRWWSWTTRRW